MTEDWSKRVEEDKKLREEAQRKEAEEERKKQIAEEKRREREEEQKRQLAEQENTTKFEVKKFLGNFLNLIFFLRLKNQMNHFRDQLDQKVNVVRED